MNPSTERRAESAARPDGLAGARRLIVKVGSALLVDEASGDIRRDWLAALAEDLARCRARGQEVLLVSSGAIAVGRRYLGLIGRALKLEEKQAAAATGQIRLAHAYLEALGRHDIGVAQILLTPDDTEQRSRHLNARARRSNSCWPSVRCRSSTRTTRSPPPKFASAITTGWPRGWRR